VRACTGCAKIKIEIKNDDDQSDFLAEGWSIEGLITKVVE